MTHADFIKKWKINKSLMATRLGLSSMTYINRYRKPSAEDEAKMLAVLAEMQNDLLEVTETWHKRQH